MSGAVKRDFQTIKDHRSSGANITQGKLDGLFSSKRAQYIINYKAVDLLVKWIGCIGCESVQTICNTSNVSRQITDQLTITSLILFSFNIFYVFFALLGDAKSKDHRTS